MTLFPVLVDVYHKEQLVTKEEAEKVASDVQRWVEVAITKDVPTTARIADILDKYGTNNVAQNIRSKCVSSRLWVYCKYCVNTVQDPFGKAQLS